MFPFLTPGLNIGPAAPGQWPQFNPWNVSQMDPNVRKAISSGQAQTTPFAKAQVGYYDFMSAAGYKQASTPNDVPNGAQMWSQYIPQETPREYYGKGSGVGTRNMFNAVTPPTVVNWYKGGEEAKPAPAEQAPAAEGSATSSGPSNNVPGNPQLTIPGINVRLTGEQIGIKPADSTARKARQTSKGSSRLTIPRSSGASGLNLG